MLEMFAGMLKNAPPGKSAAKLYVADLEVFVSNLVVPAKTIACSWSGCSGLLWDGDANSGIKLLIVEILRSN